jgi:hypothetical protein
MVKPYKESASSFSFEFGGPSEIDAETLMETIDSVVNSLQYIAKQTMPDGYFKLKVTAFRSNSFDIDLQAIVGCLPSLLLVANNAVGLIKTLLECIKIKRHLKGEKPTKVETTGETASITNSEGKVFKTDKDILPLYFNNCTLDVNFTNLFACVAKDEERESLNIAQDGKSVITVSKEEFRTMAKPVVDRNAEVYKEESNTIETILSVKKPDLLDNSQWGFKYNQNIIYAHIADEKWLEKVHNGQIRLYAGVKIPVKLKIEVNMDKLMNIIPGSKRYIVLEVTGDIIEPEDNGQISMF